MDDEQLLEFAEYPSNALIELTNSCNHACVFCKNSNQERGATHLDIKIFEEFVRQAVPLGLKELGLYATGEPFMTKNLEEYIAVAKLNGVNRIYVTTNGALADLERVSKCYEAGLNSIKFSINASNREEYKLVHGYDDFEQVLENVRNIYKWKKDNGINIQLLASCAIVPAIADLEKSHYAIFGGYFEDIRYENSTSQNGQAFQLADTLGFIPNGVFSNLGKSNSAGDVRPCQMLWNRYHLTAEGYLTGCCIDYELDLAFADINSFSLKESWNNELARKLRSAHINKDLSGLVCDQCMHNEARPYKPISDVNKKKKSDKIIQFQAEGLKKRIMIVSKINND